jgi:pimeloyl-ACP methyl ester carboxylesterase
MGGQILMSRRVWVLLRGLVREKRHWGEFPDTLQTHFPDDEIVLYDFPGNGQRCKEKSATTVIEVVEDLRSYLSDQSISKPVHIIALSLGAMVAVEWLNKYPDECASAVLISTSMRGLNPFYQRLLPSSYPAIFKSLLIPAGIERNEAMNLKLISNIVSSDKSRSEQTVNQWLNYSRQCPVAVMNGLRQLLAAIRFRVPSRQPKTPMLVLCSVADKLVSPECSFALAEHWSLPLEMHAGAGHDIPLDDGDWVCEKISQWLN